MSFYKGRGFITLPILISALVVFGLALGGGVYWFEHGQNLNPQVPWSSIEGQVNAEPTSGPAPLAVTFQISTNKSEGNITLNFGDRSATQTFGCTPGLSACAMSWPAQHTYAKPGTYTASLLTYGSSCETCQNLLIKTLGSTTITVGSSSNISVPGMSKYTDTDFGFSFWYPSASTISNSEGDSNSCYGPAPVKSITISNSDGSPIELSIYNSREGITWGCGKANDRTYFDHEKNQWMQFPRWKDFPRGIPGTPEQLVITTKTMGGLPLFNNSVVPLNDHIFIVHDSEGSNTKPFLILSTILAADPAAGTPLSTTEQIKAIQAEKDAYVEQ